MEEKILSILREIKEEIVHYSGTQMLEDEVIDSFDVMEIVAAIEDVFEIEIDPDLIISENFATVSAIVEMVNSCMNEA